MENNVTEIMENVTEAIVENDSVVMPAVPEIPDVRGKFAWVKPLAIGVALVGVYAAVRRKEIQAWSTAKRIKWLEKHGYTVVRNEDIVDETCEACDVEVAE